MELIKVAIIVFAVLLIPGFFLSLIFFKWDRIDFIERIALSFTLSLTLIPLSVFYTNLLGLPITAITISLQVGGITFLAMITILLQHLLKNKI